MKFTFSNPLDPSTVNADTVYMTREAVDGWPSTDKTLVSLNLSVSGKVLLITTTDHQRPNSRYTLYITSDVHDAYGNPLDPPITRYFTSKYTPMYMGSSVLRANFARFLVDVPEDLLNFHIFRVSLDVNRHWILYYNPLVGGPSEDQVRGQTFILSYAMERWVEYETGARILLMRYYELLERVDSMKRLADYTEEHGYHILHDLQDEIKRQTALATQWVAEFSRHRARIQTTRKSERWPQWAKNTDFSFQQFRRDQI
jgi:hypothetical protein